MKDYYQMSERPPSPTNTEWNTFQVMANPEFVNIHVPKPTFKGNTLALAQAEPLPENSPPPSPKEVQEDIGDSISVVAEKMNLQVEKPEIKLQTIAEEEETKEDDVPEPPVFPPTPRLVTPPNSPKESFSPKAVSPAKVEDEDLSYRPKVREMTESEILSEKEGLLSEISLMEKQGILKLYRELTISDSLEEIQFQ
jgi:hypothetical protein